jgi:hypothetical protein
MIIGPSLGESWGEKKLCILANTYLKWSLCLAKLLSALREEWVVK